MVSIRRGNPARTEDFYESSIAEQRREHVYEPRTPIAFKRLNTRTVLERAAPIRRVGQLEFPGELLKTPYLAKETYPVPPKKYYTDYYIDQNVSYGFVYDKINEIWVPNELSVPGSIDSGNITLTGNPQTLASTETPIDSVTVKAGASNTATMYVGGYKNQLFPLAKGEAQDFRIDDLAKIYVKGTSNDTAAWVFVV